MSIFQSREAEIALPLQEYQLRRLAQSAAQRMDQEHGWRVHRTGDLDVVRMTTPVAGSTWGEIVNIAVGDASILVQSRSRVPFQLVGLWKNRKNVQLVAEVLQRLCDDEPPT